MLPESVPNFKLQTPCCLRRGAALQTDQGSCLFERSECARDPGWTEHRRLPRSEAKGRRHQGRLFLAYLILAKQKKVSRPPRRQSGIGVGNELGD